MHKNSTDYDVTGTETESQYNVGLNHMKLLTFNYFFTHKLGTLKWFNLMFLI